MTRRKELPRADIDQDMTHKVVAEAAETDIVSTDIEVPQALSEAEQGIPQLDEVLLNAQKAYAAYLEAQRQVTKQTTISCRSTQQQAQNICDEAVRQAFNARDEALAQASRVRDEGHQQVENQFMKAKEEAERTCQEAIAEALNVRGEDVEKAWNIREETVDRHGKSTLRCQGRCSQSADD